LKEEDTVAQRQARQMEAARREELRPTKRPAHRLVLLFRGVTALSALNMAVGQVLGIVYQGAGPVQYVLRFYVVLLCLLVVLNELEYFALTVESRILHYWVTRGALYAFIGLLGLEENDTSESVNASSSSSFGVGVGTAYIKAVAWVMIGIGATYFLMGLFCLQFVYDRIRVDYERRLERAAILREGLPQHTVASIAVPPTSPSHDGATASAALGESSSKAA
jgi:hypothetical protein